MYEKLYHDLFNAITDALCYLERGNHLSAMTRLIKAQQDAEETYISHTEKFSLRTFPYSDTMDSPKESEGREA